MPYRLRQDEPLPVAVRRIIDEELRRALRLRAKRGNAAEVVHQHRVAAKRVRAVLKLVRTGMSAEDYAHWNKQYRNFARRLSPIRDADVRRTAADKLLAELDRPPSRKALAELQRRIEASGDGSLGRRRRKKLQEAAVEEVSRLRSALPELPVDRVTAGVLWAGLEACYRDASRAYALALRRPTTASLHELRKRTKDHGCQMRLLQDVWAGEIQPRAEVCGQLSRFLGEDHDLAILQSLLSAPGPTARPDAARRRTENGRSRRAPPTASKGPPTRDEDLHTRLTELIDARRRGLQAAALELARRLYVEKPRAFADRLRSYGRDWFGSTESRERPRPPRRALKGRGATGPKSSR